MRKTIAGWLIRVARKIEPVPEVKVRHFNVGGETIRIVTTARDDRAA